MRLRRQSVVWTAALATLLPLAAQADFALEQSGSSAKGAGSSGTFTATLRWNPQQASHPAVKSSEAATLQSALLALPAPAAGPATVSSPLKSAAGAVQVRLGYSGTFPFVQVVGDPAQLAGATDVPLTVEVPLASPVATAAPETDPMAVRVARDLFLNGADITALPLSTGSVTKGLPTPPGEIRVTVKRGAEIVRVPLSDLGLNEAGLATIRIDSHGQPVPVGGVIDGQLWFYMPRRVTETSSTQSVFITRNSGSPSAPMATRAAFETLAPAGTEAALVRTRDYSEFLNLQYERAAVLPVTERFVAWRITARSASNQNHTRSIELPVHDWVDFSQPVSVNATVLGHQSFPEYPDDHRTNLYFEDNKLPPVDAGQPAYTIVFDGRTAVSASGTFTLTGTGNPTESLTFTHEVPEVSPTQAADGFNTDPQMLDTVTLSWTGFPRVDPLTGRGEVEVPAGEAPRRVSMGGLPAGAAADSVMVLDVSNAVAPVRLTGLAVADANGTRFVEFEVPAAGGRYLVVHNSFLTPALFTGSAEMLPAPPSEGETLAAIVVRAPSFADAAAPLATLRTGRTVFIDPQAAYNAWSGGQPDPEAIRSAIRTIWEGSTARLPYTALILVGHGSFDRRDYLNRLTGTEIPPFVYNNDGDDPNIEDPVDYTYATIAGDDAFEDMLVGRIPARTPADAADFVSRLVAFRADEARLNALPRLGLFVVDNDDGRFGATTTDYYIPNWVQRGRPARRINVTSAPQEGSDRGRDERAAIRQAVREVNGGTALILYTGHGNFNVWANESVLRSQDVPSIMPRSEWPFVASFTCLNNLYATPGSIDRCLGETLVTTPGVGAIGVLAPGSVEPYEQQALFSYFAMEQVLAPGAPQSAADGPRTQGEWLLRSRNAFMEVFPTSDALRAARMYLLFGDPTTGLTLDNLQATGTTAGVMLQ